MTAGIAWIGAHHHTPVSAAVEGMAGGISLTAARGMAPDDFLVALGADPAALAARVPYRALVPPAGRPGRPSPRANRVMYGTCGDWVYVLEDWSAATWATGRRKVASMASRPGDEVICVTQNRFSPPAQVLHVPGDERVRCTDFGQTFDEPSELDAALRAAGAVFPAIGDVGETAAAPHYEEHAPRLPTAVLTAVGSLCGLSIGETVVRDGGLPGALLPMP
ncbi:hypothetical protein ABT160_43695 [Streptomyces sp. NPDC001941]|uniref:hypothetical protein n=1 Tax=Streptomyces sp. NPDC001941 TaxID=3154659 RepID=UPI003319E1BE